MTTTPKRKDAANRVSIAPDTCTRIRTYAWSIGVSGTRIRWAALHGGLAAMNATTENTARFSTEGLGFQARRTASGIVVEANPEQMWGLA